MQSLLIGHLSRGKERNFGPFCHIEPIAISSSLAAGWPGRSTGCPARGGGGAGRGAAAAPAGRAARTSRPARSCPARRCRGQRPPPAVRTPGPAVEPVSGAYIRHSPEYRPGPGWRTSWQDGLDPVMQPQQLPPYLLRHNMIYPLRQNWRSDYCAILRKTQIYSWPGNSQPGVMRCQQSWRAVAAAVRRDECGALALSHRPPGPHRHRALLLPPLLPQEG